VEQVDQGVAVSRGEVEVGQLEHTTTWGNASCCVVHEVQITKRYEEREPMRIEIGLCIHCSP
jgi:hypothetical protein